MNLTETIAELHLHAINCGIEVQWNHGLFAWIGQHDQPKESHWFPIKEIEDVGPWLDRKARQIYPDSFMTRPVPPTF
jgi:hypothetical protein